VGNRARRTPSGARTRTRSLAASHRQPPVTDTPPPRSSHGLHQTSSVVGSVAARLQPWFSRSPASGRSPGAEKSGIGQRERQPIPRTCQVQTTTYFFFLAAFFFVVFFFAAFLRLANLITSSVVIELARSQGPSADFSKRRTPYGMGSQQQRVPEHSTWPHAYRACSECANT